MTELSLNGAGLMTWFKLNWLFVLFLLAIASAFIFLRTSPSAIDSATEFDAVLVDGKPTIVEFYSNF